ncbi:MAG: Sbal_3080 family lipoprotein [Lautropia sp.]|nr:Sbal_3080 family lipoprotein [Lautropia sp.]
MSGCSSTNNITPVQSSENLNEVCIVKNHKVRYEEAINVIREEFGNHGISTSVVNSDKDCPIVLTYTARRGWHLASYLGRFEIHLWKNGIKLASAEYAQSRFSLTKWGDTRGRMKAMVEQLLAEYPVQQRLYSSR